MVKERKRAGGRGGGGGGGVPTGVLPHDVVAAEVLTRLPAKYLMRFKCVSKLWRSTISDPFFCKAHRARSPRAAGGLIMVYPETSSSTSSIDEEGDNHNERIGGFSFFNATLPGSRGGAVIDVLHQFSLVSTLQKEEEGLGYGFKTTNVINGPLLISNVINGPFLISNVINGLFCLYNISSVSICNFYTREIMDLPSPQSVLL